MLTTFPQGKFRYLRAPMGLNASLDKWCCRSDVIIHGLLWARKIVDDTLIWADSYRELIPRVKTVLDRCRQHNITVYIGSEITFAGHVVSSEGVKPDPKKQKAIKQFPRPTNVT